MIPQTQKIIDFLVQNVTTHPRDLVPFTAKHFSVTPVTVHRHLNKVLAEGKITKTGQKKGVIYSLPDALNKGLFFKIEPGLDESEVWKQSLAEAFSGLPENVIEICRYGFTEIFNNAIEHSAGRLIGITTQWTSRKVEIGILDTGIGIFKKLKDAFNLADERESILQLSKGKLTTDPAHHSGEGIFFTSRAFDEFALTANGLVYFKKAIDEDWFIETRDHLQDEGTHVSLTIDTHSERRLADVFKKFTNPETLQFDRTHILIALSKFGEEQYISRSQAKRVLLGTDKFKPVVLNFQGVKTVGQGFVDEVFRVFQNEHPDITFEYVNANEDVRFMIERGLPKS